MAGFRCARADRFDRLRTGLSRQAGADHRAVRTGRYKYIRWVNHSRNGELDELYDLDRDPYEISNVINRPAYRSVRERLRRELRRLVVEAGGL